MEEIIILAAAIATVSMTITKSSLFIRFRKIFNFKLFHCPYCLSHWLAFIIILYQWYPLVSIKHTINYFITSFALVAFASIFSLIIGLFLEVIDE
jgi:O-antigen/teichoic acid export membrane protein